MISVYPPTPEIDNQPLTAFGDLRVAELTPQFQGSFEYTVSNTELNSNELVNGGTITQAEAMAVVSSSATTASSALFQSKRHARYRSGLGAVCRFTSLYTAPVTGTEQLSGLGDELGSSVAFKNGYMVGYIGTDFGFSVFANDTVITTNKADWDDPLDGTGDSGMTLVQANLNVWFIQFKYLGAGAITLWVENDATGKMIKAHTVLYANKNITPSTFNPNFKFSLWVDNKATTSDLIIKSSSYSYFIEGKTQLSELHQPQFPSGEQQKTTVTTEIAILTIRNKATYAGKTNFIDIVLQNITGSIEASAANNLGKIRVVRDATLGGAPSYSDINTTDSVVEIDTSGTTVTGGKELFPTPLAGKNDSFGVNITSYNIIIAPGESVTVAGSSTNSATINGSILWKELF